MIQSQYPLKRPFLKPKSFIPNPVAKFGVPAYADSILNRKVVGTPAWKQWWEEQLYYIINGYETAGVFIPGRYYYYLNFCKTNSVKGGGSYYPSYIDFQYEYFLLVEEAKKLGKNIIIPKGRRKGMSVMSTAVVDYGWRFIHDYRVGVVAGKKEYSEDFLDKWIYLDSLIVPEFRTRKLSKTYDDIIAGWSEKDEVGSWANYGTQNKMYCRTAFSDPEIFKGKFLNDVIFEEAGEFDNFIKTIQATEACLKDGNVQYGTAYYYGTGGNIRTGSKGFEEVWHNYESYNCLRYFVDGPKYFSPCFSGATGKGGALIEDIPNLLQFGKEERFGMEDEVRAKEIIEVEKKKLLKNNKDLKKYWEYCKDNPTDIKEVFRKSASNNFPVDILNDQQYKLLSEDKKYSMWKLSFVTDPSGVIKTPYEVIATPAKEDTPEDECVLILNTGHPVAGMRNLDVAGCLTPGEKVMTDDGLVNIEDVTKGHLLINEKGEYVGINELQRYNVLNEKTFEVKVSNTFRSTTFTGEHPVLVSRPMFNSDKTINRKGLCFSYTKVSDVLVNDWIKVPNIYRKGNPFDINSLWDDNTYRKSESVKSPLMDSDFWWLVGLWLGDGWCGSDKRKISFSINVNEYEYGDRLVAIVSRLFKRKISIRDRNKGCLEMTFCSEQLNRFLCKNFGKYAGGKYIPEWAKRISDTCKKQLVLGYLDSDGSISVDKKRNLYNTQFISINLELLESIQDILFSLGHVSQLCKLREASESYCFPGRSIPSVIKECYQLRLGNEDTVNLVGDLWNDFDPKLRRVDFSNIKKTRKRAADGCFVGESLEYIYFQIREIKTGYYSGIVYNFDCETHTFMCHHITTHNCDSYDQDLAMTSSSLGSMVVLRRDHNIQDQDRMTPVCLIRCRPKRREQFYEMCLMVSIYYDLKYNTLIDVGKPAIIDYYKQRGCAIYLAKRPIKFESEKSEQNHEYGFAITSHSKPIMLGLLQSYFCDHADKIWFNVLLDEALSYDEGSRTSESDKDAVDALGIALVQLNAQNTGVINDNERKKRDPYAFPEYQEDGNGNMIPVSKVDVNRYHVKNKELTDEQLWERKIEMDMLRENLREEDDDDY